MGYKIYMRSKGGKKVERLNDVIYETSEEAEAAMINAAEKRKGEKTIIPLVGQVFSAGQVSGLGEHIMAEQSLFPKEEAIYFIQKV